MRDRTARGGKMAKTKHEEKIAEKTKDKADKEQQHNVLRLDVDLANDQTRKGEISLEHHLEEILVQHCGPSNYDMRVLSVPGELKGVEFESVAVKVPKRILDYLRGIENLTGNTAIEQLEYNLVENFRAYMEGLDGMDLIKDLELGPVFKAVLGDERFS